MGPLLPASANEVIVVASEHYGSYFEGMPASVRPCTLVREPTNAYDRNAVMVFVGGRQRGYLSAARAVKYAALLDRLGEVETVLRLDGRNAFVQIPKPDDLAAWIEGRSNSA